MEELERVEGGETGWIGLYEKGIYCQKYQTKFLKNGSKLIVTLVTFALIMIVLVV